MAKDIMAKIGSWSFLLGILIALVCGLYQAYTIENEALAANYFFSTDTGAIVAWVLAIIGILVGILAFMGKGTIEVKEFPAFLMAGIALVVMYGVFKGIYIPYYIGSLLQGISQSLAIFVAPTVGILAIIVIWAIGRD